MSLNPARRNSVLTLSSSNLLALKHVESDLIESTKRKLSDASKESVEHYQYVIEISKTQLLKKYLMTDFWNNLSIVTLPACFTNFIWRLMNLYGIAVSHNFWNIVGETTWEIGTVVFVICFIIDASRQCYLYQKQQKYDNTYSQIFNLYYSNWGLLSSSHLAFKFFMAVIFWTIGYELIANDHQIYTDKSDVTQIIYRSLGAGMGTFFGLVIASQIIALTEYYSGVLISMTRLKPYSVNKSNIKKRKGFFIDTNQKGIFGVGFKGFCEGIAWSILADIDLYIMMENSGINSNGSIILDSLVVGILSSLFFTLMGFYTSLMGYCETYTINWHRKRKLSAQRRRHEADESIFDDGLTTPEFNDVGSTVSDLSSETEYQALL